MCIRDSFIGDKLKKQKEFYLELYTEYKKKQEELQKNYGD